MLYSRSPIATKPKQGQSGIRATMVGLSICDHLSCLFGSTTHGVLSCAHPMQGTPVMLRLHLTLRFLQVSQAIVDR